MPDDDDATLHVYALPTARLPVTIKGTAPKKDAPITEAKVTVQWGPPKYYPDPSNMFMLKYTHNKLSDDTFTFQSDSNPYLLKKVATTSKDRTAEVIPLITSTLQELKKASAAIKGFTGRPPLVSFEYHGEIDPDDPAKVTRDLARVAKGWGLTLKAHPGPFRVNGKSVEADMSIATSDCTKGVCFRLPRPYEFELSSTEFEYRAKTTFWLPNHGFIGVVDFKRRAFVENKVSAEFNNGMLTKLELSDPSEVVGFLKLPSSIIQLIVAGATLGG